MKLRLGKRKYRIVLLILIAGSIFICFQLFTLKVLNFSSKKEAHAYQAAKVFEDFGESLDKNLQFQMYSDKQAFEGNIDTLKNQDHAKPHKNKNIDVKMVLGILVTQSEDYKPSEEGMFTCLDSKVGKSLRRCL